MDVLRLGINPYAFKDSSKEEFFEHIKKTTIRVDLDEAWIEVCKLNGSSERSAKKDNSSGSGENVRGVLPKKRGKKANNKAKY